MFYFPEKTETQIEIDKNIIFKAFNNGKPTSDSDMVDGVEIRNIIDSSTTNLKSSEDYRLIYNIWIWVNDRVIPTEFLRVLDKQMDFPVVYQIITSSDGDRISILPVKRLRNNHFEIIRVFSSGWFLEGVSFKSDKTFETIEDAYKSMIEMMSFQKFNKNETIPDFIKRTCDDYNSGDKLVIEENGCVDESVQAINKGYRDYSSIKNTIRVYTALKIQRIKIKTYAYKNEERITFHNKELGVDLKEGFDLKNARIIYDKPYYNTIFPELISFDYALKKVKQLYSKIDKLKESNPNNENILQPLLEQLALYESVVMRESSLYNRIEIDGLVNGELKTENWSDYELERMLINGCTIKHYTFYPYEVYDFSEIKHRVDEEDTTQKRHYYKNSSPQKRKLTADDIEELKKYSSKKIN